MVSPNKNTNHFQSRVKALTSWGFRDNRDGFIDSHSLKQSEELFKKISQQGINFSLYNDIPVQSSEIFPVIDDFKDCEVDQCLLDNLLKFGYKRPTPVQRYAIPISLMRKDLIACAQTGSGKTAAYLYPLIAKMMQDGPPPTGPTFVPRPLAVILAPTRELATQIHQESLKLTFLTGIISLCCYGGTPIDLQIASIHKGIDLLIGTPGRIIDLLGRQCLDISIVRYMVLDEADRMLDMGFEPQLIRILEFIHKKERETVMCSATFPLQIQNIAKKYLRDYVFLSVGKVGSTTENIHQQVHLVNYKEKLPLLMNLLRPIEEKVLSNFYVVFVEKKASAEALKQNLCRAGLSANSIHGDKNQFERERSLNDFRNGKCMILVATDVASRGLDIPNVQYVVIYDLPGCIDQYIHRIGRTGRIGNKGTAIVLIEDLSKPIIPDLVKTLKESNQTVPDWLHGTSHPLLGNSHNFQKSSYEDRRKHAEKFNNTSNDAMDWTSEAVSLRTDKENKPNDPWGQSWD